MDTGTEKESQSQLLAMEAGDGLLELANTPGVELANTPGCRWGRCHLVGMWRGPVDRA